MSNRVTRFVAVLALSLLSCFTTLAADPAKPSDLSGKVVDKAGQPIGNAEVILYYVDFKRPESAKTVGSAKSAADGAFTFPAAISWPDAVKNQFQRYYLIANDNTRGIGFAVILADDKMADVAVPINGKQAVKVAVTGPDGKPVGDASVRLSWCAPKTPDRDHLHASLMLGDGIKLNPTTTDANGEAVVTVPPDSNYRLVATKAGFAKSYGGLNAPEKISLAPAGTVTGKVTSADGKPAAGVRVTYSYVRGQMGNSDATLTDDQGRYEFKDIPAQAADSSADAPVEITGATLKAEDTAVDVFASVSTTVTVKANEIITKDLVLQKELELAGVVVDAATDKPLAGMTIYFSTYGRPGISGGRMIVSDEQGRFRTGVSRGANVQINLNVGNPAKYLIDDTRQMEEMGRSQMIQAMNADKKDLKLRAYLIPTRSLTGKVADAAGGPLGKIGIYTDPRAPMISTDTDGSFTLNNAPADRPFAILASTDGRGGIASVTPDQKEVTIQLQPTVERELIAATQTGQGVEGLTISAFPLFKETSWYQRAAGGQTDAAGKLSLKNLIPGATYQITWNSSKKSQGRGQMRADISTANTADPIRCNIRTYTNTFAGKVVNSKDQPIANARFEFASTEVFNQQEMGRAYNTRTSADGSFKFEQLADGNVDLIVSAPENYRRMHVCLPTNKADAKIVLHTSNEPAQQVVGVRDENGKPVAGASLLLYYRTRGDRQSGQDTIKTDENGDADLWELEADHISVVCDRSGYALAAVTIQSYEEGQYLITLTKAMPPRRVRVVDGSGKPIGGLPLRVSSFSAARPDGMGGHNSMTQVDSWSQELLDATGMVQTTDAEGRATFPRISYNQYMGLQVKSPTYGEQHLNVQASQSDAVAELRLSVPGSIAGKVTVKGDARLDLSKYRVQLLPHQGGAYGEAELRADGTYKIANVVPGTFTPSVMTWNRSPSAQKYKLRGDHTFTVEAGKPVTLDLELEEGIPVRGRLEYKADKAAKGRAQVSVMAPNDGNLNGVDVGADGSFECYVAGPGTYQVMYLIPGTNQWNNAPSITVPDDKPLEGVVITPAAK